MHTLTPHFSDHHLALHLEQVHGGEAGEGKEAEDEKHGTCGRVMEWWVDADAAWCGSTDGWRARRLPWQAQQPRGSTFRRHKLPLTRRHRLTHAVLCAGNIERDIEENGSNKQPHQAGKHPAQRKGRVVQREVQEGQADGAAAGRQPSQSRRCPPNFLLLLEPSPHRHAATQKGRVQS